MDPVDRLIAAIDASGIKHVRIASDADIPTSKFSKIYRRKQIPNAREYFQILRAIGRDAARVVTEGELLVETERLRAAYEASVDLREVSTRLAAILEEMLPRTSPVHPLPKPNVPHTAVAVPAAANPNADLLVAVETERQQIPRRAWLRGARIIARVKGDSMDGGDDPIRDGDLAYLKPTRSPRTARGHVVLVRRENALYLKKLETSGHTIRLVSANPDEATMVLDARAEDLQIYGIVVDHGPAG
jgi:phage repressor protein C with HTH and peptisase S24 domain